MSNWTVTDRYLILVIFEEIFRQTVKCDLKLLAADTSVANNFSFYQLSINMDSFKVR